LGKIVVQVTSLVKFTSQKALQHLAKNSEWLQQQQAQFLAISGDFITNFFYETYKMHIPGYGHILVRLQKLSELFPPTERFVGSSKVLRCYSRSSQFGGDCDCGRPQRHG
jgi:hypothetical protein